MLVSIGDSATVKMRFDMWGRSIFEQRDGRRQENESCSDHKPANPRCHRDQLLEPLLERVIFAVPTSDPLVQPVRVELEALISRLGCNGSCVDERRATIVKATCAAALPACERRYSS